MTFMEGAHNDRVGCRLDGGANCGANCGANGGANGGAMGPYDWNPWGQFCGLGDPNVLKVTVTEVAICVENIIDLTYSYIDI